MLRSEGPLIEGIIVEHAVRAGNELTPRPPSRKATALVDTGASISCVDITLATSLDLPIIDRRPLQGVGGASEVPVYLCRVLIPDLGEEYGQLYGAQLSGSRFQVLIGRTLLQHYVLNYDGPNGVFQMLRGTSLYHPPGPE